MQMLTIGFHSVTVGFSQRNYTPKPMIGFPKCVKAHGYCAQVRYEAQPLEGPYIVATSPPQIFLYVTLTASTNYRLVDKFREHHCMYVCMYVITFMFAQQLTV